MKTNTKTQKPASSNANSFFNSSCRRQKVLKLILFLGVMLSAVGAKAGDLDTAWTWMTYPIPEDVKFMPDGKSMLCATRGGIFHLDLNKNILDTFHLPSRQIDISPDGTKFVSTDDNSIIIFDLILKDIVKTISFDNNLQVVHTVKISKNGRYIIAYIGNRNNENSYNLNIWDAISYQLLKEITIKDWKIGNGGFVIDSKSEYFLVSENRYTKANYQKISKWKIGTWEKVSDILVFPEESTVSEMAISPDCKYIACAMQSDSTVNIYDYETGKYIKRYLHTEGEYFVATTLFSNNSKYIISGLRSQSSISSNTKIWNLETNEMIKSYPFILDRISIATNSKYICGIGGNMEWGGLILINSPSEFTSVLEEEILVSPETVLPNPTTNQADIKLSLKKIQNVTVDLLNEIGIKLFNVFSGVMPEGENNLTLDLNSYPSGMYLCRVQTQTSSKTIKIVKQY